MTQEWYLIFGPTEIRVFYLAMGRPPEKGERYLGAKVEFSEKINPPCLLEGYGKCAGKIDGHHWINKAKYRGNKAAKKYVEKFAWFFIQPVCSRHNAHTKEADTKWARKTILQHLDTLYGVGVCRAIVDGIPWKVPPPELSYFGIMAGPDKEKW